MGYPRNVKSWAIALLFVVVLLTSSEGAERNLRPGDLSMARLATNCLSIVLEAQGDENALGFSLCFDTNLLTYVSARRGPGGVGSTLGLYTSQASKGRVGFSMLLPFGQTFPAGSVQILEVCFRAAAGPGIVTTPITVCDEPIRREMADGNGAIVTATYSDATATLIGSCSYHLETNRVISSASGGPRSVHVDADIGCPWTAVSGDDWITVTSGPNGTGPGIVNYTVAANPDFVGRTGVVTIAGQVFSVSQLQQVCTYTVDPTDQVLGPGTGTGTASVAAGPGCAWIATTATGWITLVSGTNGTGPGSVTYTVAANPDFAPRTGIITIAGRPFTVSQGGRVCAYALEPTHREHSSGRITGTFTVTASSGCSWMVSNPTTWISITSSTNGVGVSNVNYALASNPSSLARTGIIAVASQAFTVVQAGSECEFAIEPSFRVHSPASEFAIVNVTAPDACEWSIINTNDWMIIKIATGGIGNGIARYTVFDNPNPATRYGYLTIAGKPFNVVQLGAPCTFSVLPTERLIGAGYSTGAVAVGAVDGCRWTILNTNSWITITSPTSGLGAGSFAYSVTASLVPNDRIGTLNVSGELFKLTQLGSTCSASISPTTRSNAYSGGSGTVAVSLSSGCSGTTWRVYNPYDWITVTANATATGNATVSYNVAANPTGSPRTAVLTIADRLHTITQGGAPCSFTFLPASPSHGYESTTASVSLTTIAGCAWNLVNTSSWITVLSSLSGSSNATVTYRVGTNTGPARSARLSIAGQPSSFVTVNQGQASPVVFNSLPSSQGVALGATVTLTAAAGGTAPMSYQWQFNGNNLIDSQTIRGATTTSLTLSNVQPGLSGSYSIVARNIRGPATSSPPAILSVNSPPVLSAIPFKIVPRGGLVTFTASATDSEAPGQSLTYSLGPGAPSGASINPVTGVFSWTPGAAQSLGTNAVTIRVTDNGSPSLSDTETAIIIVALGSTTNLTLIPAGSVWKYRDTGQDLGTTWSGLGFDDSSWGSGPALIGYGDGNEITEVGYGSSSSAKYITTYFRCAFNVAEASVFSALNLNVLRNDGAVIYLNGGEIYRNNMPSGIVRFSTLASTNSSKPDRSSFHPSAVDVARLVSGENIIAAEIHIYSPSAGNMDFDLELKGTKTSIPPVLLAQPQSQVVLAGGTATFNVNAASDLPLKYQWHFLGAPVAGAVTAALSLTNVQPSMAGGYSVIVSNSAGSATSAVALLVVTLTTNDPPVMEEIATRAVSEGALLSFTALASDPNGTGQTLTFSLSPGAPTGATVNPTTGLFNWTPPSGYAPSINAITLQVTDNGSPPMSDAKTFNVVVLSVSAPRVTRVALGPTGGVSLTWTAASGRRYQLQYTTNLEAGPWVTLDPVVMATGSSASITDYPGLVEHLFYRVMLIE